MKWMVRNFLSENSSIETRRRNRIVSIYQKPVLFVKYLSTTGLMQKGYEHSLPKEKRKKSSRYVLVFRKGTPMSVNKDSGFYALDPITNTLISPKAEESVEFGHPATHIIEGNSSYSRLQLVASRAHWYAVHFKYFKICPNLILKLNISPFFLTLKLGSKRRRWKYRVRLPEHCRVKTGKNAVD